MRRGTTTDDVKHRGLIDDMVKGKKREEILTKRMADRKLSDERGHDDVKTVVITGNGEFSEKSERVTDTPSGAEIITAEEGIIFHDCFKLKMEIGLDLVPGRVGRRWRDDSRVVSRNEDGVRGRKRITKANNGKIVVSVIVIGAWFPGETHTGKGTKLSGHVGFEENVELDEMGGDRETEHFETLEENGLTVLGLIEGGIIVGKRPLGAKLRLTERRKLSGGGRSVDIKRGGTIS